MENSITFIDGEVLAKANACNFWRDRFVTDFPDGLDLATPGVWRMLIDKGYNSVMAWPVEHLAGSIGGEKFALLRPNLSGEDLRDKLIEFDGWIVYADLSGADLRGADLHGLDFDYTILDGADLRGANLRGAEFGERSVEDLLKNAVTDDTTIMPDDGLPAHQLEDDALERALQEHWEDVGEYFGDTVEEYIRESEEDHFLKPHGFAIDYKREKGWNGKQHQSPQIYWSVYPTYFTFEGECDVEKFFDAHGELWQKFPFIRGLLLRMGGDRLLMGLRPDKNYWGEAYDSEVHVDEDWIDEILLDHARYHYPLLYGDDDDGTNPRRAGHRLRAEAEELIGIVEFTASERCKEIAASLESDYDYRCSKEQFIETAAANGWLFDDDGRITGGCRENAYDDYYEQQARIYAAAQAAAAEELNDA